LIESDNHDIRELVKQYRLYLRTTQTQAKSRGTHGAFPTTLQGKTTDGSPADPPTTQGKNAEGKPKCICNEYHYYSQCPHIIPQLRPKDWKTDETVQKRIEKAMDDSSRTRKRIEFARKKAAESENLSAKPEKPSAKPSAKPSTNDDDNEPGAFMVSTPANYVIVNSDQSTTSYALHNSFILDSRATIHCCNTHTRFHNLTPAAVDDILVAGQDYIPIKAFGDVYINVEGPYGPKRIILRTVAYVPTFHTSVVSLRKFIKRDVH
jgi:hypothetical protein